MKDKIGLGLVIAGGFCFILSQIFGILLFQTFNLYIFNIIFLVLALGFAIAGIIVNHRWKKYLSIVITAATITSAAPWLAVIGFILAPKDHFYEGTPATLLQSRKNYLNYIDMPDQTTSLAYPIYDTHGELIDEIMNISFTRTDVNPSGSASERFVYHVAREKDTYVYFDSDGSAVVSVERQAFQIGEILDTYYSFPKEDALNLMNKAKELISTKKQEHEEDKALVLDEGDIHHFITSMEEKTFPADFAINESYGYHQGKEDGTLLPVIAEIEYTPIEKEVEKDFQYILEYNSDFDLWENQKWKYYLLPSLEEVLVQYDFHDRNGAHENIYYPYQIAKEDGQNLLDTAKQILDLEK